jgi:hypothetical protein
MNFELGEIVPKERVLTQERVINRDEIRHDISNLPRTFYYTGSPDDREYAVFVGVEHSVLWVVLGCGFLFLLAAVV